MYQSPPPIVHKRHGNTISTAGSAPVVEKSPLSFLPLARRPKIGRRAATTTAVAILCGLAVGACGPDKPPTTPSATPTLSAPSTTATPPSGDAKTMALAAYSGMWKAYAKAGLTANPDDPDLAAHAADPALKLLRDALAGYRDKKQVFKGEYGSHPTVVETSPKDRPVGAVIADCLDSRNFLVYKANGDLADDVPGGRRSTSATVQLLGGTWKVTSFAIREKGTC